MDLLRVVFEEIDRSYLGSKKSLEVYQHLSLESVDKAYQEAVQIVGI